MERSTPKPRGAEDSSRTLRQLLAASPPRTFKLSRAWAPLLRGLRQARKAGATVRFADRKVLNRALDTPPRQDPDQAVWVAQLKELLGAIARGEEDLATAADEALAVLLPRVVTEPVRLRVTGWPPGMDADGRARLLGAPEHAMRPAEEAAGVARRLHGLVLAGRVLQVRADIADDDVLPPPPPRPRPRWNRGKPWLSVDEEGRWSLTPRHIADAQAALAGPGPVVDAFCGCGGNAVAFALAGLSVTAVELDGGRLRMARENARRFGVVDAIHFVRGDTRSVTPERLTDGATVFLDPPWGGPGQAPLTWAALLGPLPADWPGLRARLLVKAPAAFDVATLPPSHDWTVRYAFGAVGADDASVVKLLTLSGELR